MSPKVSIIVPVFNAERYLDATINSILTQSLKSIELICVDDGSTDGSVRILKKYAENDSRVLVVDGLHKGAGEARNVGLRKANGEYLLFLDSDDLFHSDLCEEAYTYAKNVSADILFWDFNDISYDVNEITNTKTKGRSRYPERVNLVESQNYSFSITNPACWTKIYRKQFVMDNNLKFQNLSTCNDIAFSWLALAFAKRVFYLDRVLTYYRTNFSGQISEKRHLRAKNIVLAAQYILDHLLAHKSSVYVVDRFYEDIMKCMLYEYACFPSASGASSFVAEVRRFFPERYRVKFEYLLKRERVKISLRSLKRRVLAYLG